MFRGVINMATESLYIVPHWGKDIFIWATSAAEAREKAETPLAEPALAANIAAPKTSSFVAPPMRASRIRETSAHGA
jgi:hypothetical protein